MTRDKQIKFMKEAPEKREELTDKLAKDPKIKALFEKYRPQKKK